MTTSVSAPGRIKRSELFQHLNVEHCASSLSTQQHCKVALHMGELKLRELKELMQDDTTN